MLQYRRQALGGARDSRQWSSVETEEAPEAQDQCREFSGELKVCKVIKFCRSLAQQ
jgi:hypothetical protein